MTNRRRIRTALGALTHQDWVTVALCFVILVVFVVSIVGLALGSANVHK
jgi:cell division protein FtsX